jgi:NADH-quinone oxidoreductase subunit C
MDTKLQTVVQQLEQEFGASAEEYRGEAHVTIKPDQVVAVARTLHDKQGFELLSTITAVDYWPQEDPRFHLVYIYTSLSKNLVISIRVPLSATKLQVETIVGVYASANWRERELWDMFGIKFEGHPDLRRILMPEDWAGFPLRKDYPLGYEEPQFTFNFEEISLRKPHATE